MRVVPERSLWLHIIGVLGGFFIGPYSALRVADLLVPESEVVQVAASFGFAAIFLGGAMVWMGLGVAAVVVRALASLIRGRAPRPPGSPGDRLVPPGYGVFIVLGALVGVIVGLLAGLVTQLGVFEATLSWGLLGTVYGVLLWWAAHQGYLPFPEPE